MTLTMRCHLLSLPTLTQAPITHCYLGTSSPSRDTHQGLDMGILLRCEESECFGFICLIFLLLVPMTPQEAV